MEAQPVILKLSSVLKKYYESKQKDYKLTQEAVVGPLYQVVEYITMARKVGLDRRKECAYAGTKFLHSVLGSMGFRFADNVEEANELFLIGTRVAGHIWDLLDASEGGGTAFSAKVKEIEAFLYAELRVSS